MPDLGYSHELLCVCSRWEEEKKEDGIKWMQLEHRGPYFVPPYEPLPKDVQFYYDGTAVGGPGAWGGALSLGRMNIPLEKPWVQAGGSCTWLELQSFWGADPNCCFFSLSCILGLSFVSHELEKWDFTDPWPQGLTHPRILLGCSKLLMSPGSPHITLEQFRVSLAGQIHVCCLCVFVTFPLGFLLFPALSSSLNSFLMDQREREIRTVGVSPGMVEMERDHIPLVFLSFLGLPIIFLP